jgi:hypothetical protein
MDSTATKAALFIYGLSSGLLSWLSGQPWRLGNTLEQVQMLLAATAGLGIVNLSARAACSARIYG